MRRRLWGVRGGGEGGGCGMEWASEWMVGFACLGV